MKIWLTKNNGVPVREQIVTQVRIAVASGELRPGQKLPSTRELARRFGVHPNTVSSAYSELAASGDVINKHGSGIYVRNGGETEKTLETLINSMLAEAADLGFTRQDVIDHLNRTNSEFRGFAVIEPNPALRQILMDEVAEATQAEVIGVDIEDLAANPFHGYRFTAMFDEEPKLAGKLGERECVFLKPNSVANAMTGRDRPDVSEVIAAVSGWDDFLTLARLFLIAAKVDADAIVTCSTGEPDWPRRIKPASRIICDISTARLIGDDERVNVFHVIAESSLNDLRQIAGL